MGLDITAYSNLVRLSAEDQQKLDAYRNGGKYDGPPAPRYDVHIDASQCMPERLAGLAPGWYASGDGKRVSFRAGSYSGYNRWREALAQMALGTAPATLWAMPEAEQRGRPFIELIHFSDCEGAIGPEVSAKLHRDFLDHKKRAEEFAANMMSEERRWFMDKYEDWTHAFELAAQGGCVNFH